jgi:hypothetical protein
VKTPVPPKKGKKKANGAESKFLRFSFDYMNLITLKVYSK